MARKQRLPLDAYEVDGSCWHVTTRTDQRVGAPFTDLGLGQLLLKTWLIGCQQSGAVPHLVCIMPDHLHMIVEVRSTGLVEIMRRLKSNSTALWRVRSGKSILWQQSFYDHGLREARDFDEAVKYILANPIEAGLAAAWEEYPLLGGELIESTRQ